MFKLKVLEINALLVIEYTGRFTVDLKKAETTIDMETHIPLETFQEVLKNESGRYSIHKQGEHQHLETKKETPAKGKGTETFYCPMHCEGDKTYDKPADCPVCGMDLVEQHSLSTEQWTCSMHPEVIKKEAGKGVEAIIGLKKVALGNPKMMEYAEADITSKMKGETKTYQKQGKTVSFLAIDNTIVGYVVIGDKIKETSAKAIKALLHKGIDVIMLTCDNYDTAEAVASELNLTDFKAGMLPEDKLKEVEKLQANGKVVAVAGDGINDAPSLTAAHVGVSFGVATDIAINASEVVLIDKKLEALKKTILIGRQTNRTIIQNFFWAFIYNLFAIPFAAFGFLTPIIAALIMGFSDVIVIGNSILLKLKKT